MFFLRCCLFAGLGLTAAANAAPTISGTVLYAFGKPTSFPNQGLGVFSVTSGGQAAGRYFDASGTQRALIWSPQNTSGTDITPSSYVSGAISATDGSQQVGVAVSSGGSSHAILWNGSATSYVDLNSSDFTRSSAEGLTTNQQVGYATLVSSGAMHAIVWNGSASNYTDLNPASYASSYAYATNGPEQVGGAYLTGSTINSHAALWSGSANSFVDLNPSGYFSSSAAAISPDGAQEAGYTIFSKGAQSRAALWTGSSNSYQDLNPIGYAMSFINDTNGTYQVGSGMLTSGGPYALLWSGTSGYFINLQSYLPAYLTDSDALSIVGNEVYGFADDTSGNRYAVEWSLPEPSALTFVSFAVLFWGRRGRQFCRRGL